MLPVPLEILLGGGDEFRDVVDAHHDSFVVSLGRRDGELGEERGEVSGAGSDVQDPGARPEPVLEHGERVRVHVRRGDGRAVPDGLRRVLIRVRPFQDVVFAVDASHGGPTASLAMSLAKRLSMSSSFVAPLLRHAMVKMDGTQRSARAARFVSRDAKGAAMLPRQRGCEPRSGR